MSSFFVVEKGFIFVILAFIHLYTFSMRFKSEDDGGHPLSNPITLYLALIDFANYR